MNFGCLFFNCEPVFWKSILSFKNYSQLHIIYHSFPDILLILKGMEIKEMWESKQTISTDCTTRAIELSYLEIKRYITNTLKK